MLNYLLFIDLFLLFVFIPFFYTLNLFTFVLFSLLLIVLWYHYNKCVTLNKSFNLSYFDPFFYPF